MDGSDDSPLYEHCADAMASLLPKAIEHGIVDPEEIDIANIPQCFRAAINAHGYAMSSMPTVLAWCRAH